MLDNKSNRECKKNNHNLMIGQIRCCTEYFMTLYPNAIVTMPMPNSNEDYGMPSNVEKIQQ